MGTGSKPGSPSGSRAVSPQGDGAGGPRDLSLVGTGMATFAASNRWETVCIDNNVVAPGTAPPTIGGSSTEQTPAATSDAEATTTSTNQTTDPVTDPAADIISPSEETSVGEALEAGGIDDDDEFTPSVFDEGSIADDRTDSTSLNSSVYEHSFKNGRRYHKFRHGRYPIPNDETEQNREDMLHAMMLEVTDGRLYFAPIGNSPQKIIDLGTGTGIWAIESGFRLSNPWMQRVFTRCEKR
ncbi:secondary metabolism regulator LAE1 [Colletotrichum spaethianum]|uniref:Secondary metabolism regulator LAE1 n=1 Tax=Colletotrichum spaethianum TaxID=700344 RepID=A0AA37P1R3_9PEZI|nr:secondary metabolism regulator LAE1 [Colletotrichum spaethianum]GKT45233.1 secondary metabolism regulator LAE1 [Colletotrichum spaethianum]